MHAMNDGVAGAADVDSMRAARGGRGALPEAILLPRPNISKPYNHVVSPPIEWIDIANS
jgi:hypothetical protein